MTRATTPPIVEYIENGVTLVHAIPFQFNGADEILVYRRAAPGEPVLLTQGAEYSVTGGAGGTGSITKTNGGTAGATLRIRRATARSQPTDYGAHGDFPAEIAETALDRQLQIAQEVGVEAADLAARALRVPDGETVAALPPAAGRLAKFIGFDQFTGAIAMISDQTLANRIGDLVGFSYTGFVGPGSDLATHYDSYHDASGNDTATFATALTVAAATTGVLKVSPGNYYVDKIDVPTGVALIGAGSSLTHIYQNADPSGVLSCINVVGSRAKVKGLHIIGRIATHLYEFNHGVGVTATLATGSMDDIEIEDIRVQDVRGDGVYIGTNSTAYAGGARLKNVRVCNIAGDNIYRNGFSITGGSDISVDGWAFTRVGIYDWDIETNAGGGPVERVSIGSGKGALFAVAGTTAADYVDAAEIGFIDADPSYTARSVPPYPLTKVNSFEYRNVKRLNIEGLHFSNFGGAGLGAVGGNAVPRSIINIGSLATINCQQAAAAIAPVLATTTGVEINIGTWRLETNGAFQHGMVSSGNGNVKHITAALYTGSKLFNGSSNNYIGRLDITNNGGGAGGVAFVGGSNNVVLGGTIIADVLCGYGCTNTVISGVTATVTTEVSVATNVTLTNVVINGLAYGLRYYAAGSVPTLSIDGTGAMSAGYITATSRLTGYVYDPNGIKVTGTQGAAIANAIGSAGSVPTGVEFNQHATAINYILILLRAWGAIAP